ncbi:MAG: zinc dependent phospholipase C family protein [Bacteroidota bacterium]|jgi:hypothetical protein
MKRIAVLVVFTGILTQGFGWGFYAHKVINRLAVFTLPPELFAFYKAHLEDITEHAVDPDKRRYSDPEEACRHYVDLDYFEHTLPLDTMPRKWKDAVARYTEDTLKAYGIVPWHIQLMMNRLTEAFKEKNIERIIRLSADLGHYIADAHVPLHATINYNGQLTGQQGIHAFWESRLPELYSDQYDFFVGRAQYLNNELEEAWRASEGSFAAKDSVLAFERELNKRYDSDKKYSYEMKGQTRVRQFSEEYSSAYHRMLGDQVERRMRQSILTVGSMWYTAWINAGKPDLIKESVPPAKLTDEERKRMVAEEQNMMWERKMLGRQEN